MMMNTLHRLALLLATLTIASSRANNGAQAQEDECTKVVYTDVVIVGAGTSGLAAASRLQKVDPDLNFVLLESQDRVGGRVRSTVMGVAPPAAWRRAEG